MESKPPYLTNHTALRGIAAFLVVLYHANERLVPFVKNETTFWFHKLYVMVDLFFVLSGFIMCYVYEAEFQNDQLKHHRTRRFLLARLARIYPLHLVTLLVGVAAALVTWRLGKYAWLGEVGTHVRDFRAIPSQLLLLHSMHLNPIFTWNVPSWSISAEWGAYLLFPFLVRPFSRAGLATTWLILAVLFGGYALLIFQIGPNKAVLYPFLASGATLNVTYDWGFLRGILGFTLGMAAYRLYHQNYLKASLSSTWLLVALVGAYSVYAHLNLSDLAMPAFFLLLVLATAYGNKFLDAALNQPLFQKLGLWSYSLYMWHMVLVDVAEHVGLWRMRTAPVEGPSGPPNYFGLTNTWVILLGYLVLTLVLGWLSYTYLETPSRRWLNHLARPRQAAQVPPAPAPALAQTR